MLKKFKNCGHLRSPQNTQHDRLNRVDLCRICESARSKRYYQAHKEERRAYYRRRRQGSTS